MSSYKVVKTQDIESVFTMIKGLWNSNENEYTNRTEEDFPKILQMSIDETDPKQPVIHFHGGPTGWESYYIEDLLRPRTDSGKSGELCICGGTINRWARCVVPFQPVLDFIKEYEDERKNRS